MLETHACNAEGCSQACPTSHLMCVRHWRMVPADLRREVFAAYREFKGARRRQGCSSAITAAQALRVAQANAIAAVRAKEQLKQVRLETLQKPLFD